MDDSEFESSLLRSSLPRLSSDQRTRLLLCLVRSATPTERQEWQELFCRAFQRDFVSLLPTEICLHLLSFLDAPSLLRAAQVSVGWNRVLDGHARLWRQRAVEHGARDDEGHAQQQRLREVQSYKSSLCYALRLRRRLHTGKAFVKDQINVRPEPDRSVVALDYQDGSMAAITHGPCNATGAVGHLLIWKTNNPSASPETGSSRLKPVPEPGCCSHKLTHFFDLPPIGVKNLVVKLFMPKFAFVGDMSGKINCYKLDGRDGGVGGVGGVGGGLLRVLHGHAATVFSLDGCLRSDLLVSGSADNCVKLWRLKTGALLRSVSSQLHWITSLIFRPSFKTLSKENVLLTMSKYEIHVFVWPSKKSGDGDGDGDSDDDLKTNPVFGRPPQQRISVCGNDGYEDLRDVFYTPGMHLNEYPASSASSSSASSSDPGWVREITFVRQMPIFETQTIGDVDIVTVDVSSGRVTRRVHLNRKVRKLLAVGRRFALVLLPFVNSQYHNLVVFDLAERKVVGGCTVPHSRCTTPDFSQICVGDQGWLDGLSPDMFTSPNHKMVIGLTEESTIQLVQWNSDPAATNS